MHLIALQSYEVQLKLYAHQLERLIAQSAGKPTNINQYIYWFSFDVMGQFAFSKPFDMLIGKRWHHAVQMLRAGLALVGPLSPTPWLVRLAVDFPVVSVVRDFQKMEAWCADQMDERIEVSHYLISWSKKHDRIEKDKNTLYGDAIALIVAGSDTAAHTLIYLFFHLARRREHLSKLQQELATIDSIENLRALQSLPYLNGLINETLRLHPPVPTGGLRETPAEGVWIAGRFVPGNTTICAPRYTLARLESCFTHANEFIPERWFSKPKLVKNKNAFAPFALGRYYCIGKNLAYSELRYVAALLVSKYDISLAPGETGARVVEDMVDQFTASPGQLELVFSERGD
ncbi:MAG: hypothetical protein LQ351_004365 [Letrouitia transgressa]|nr:MAG: hypothetical protein LQ351_004365 [Letrouitia transgressa]